MIQVSDDPRDLITKDDLNYLAEKTYMGVEDDLVAAWAGDSLARVRSYAIYGSLVEAPDREDKLVIAEWRRRCKIRK